MVVIVVISAISIVLAIIIIFAMHLSYIVRRLWGSGAEPSFKRIGLRGGLKFLWNGCRKT